MHAYKVTIRSPQGNASYNAVAYTWFDCFMAAANEFGVRAVICVRPV